MAWHEFWSAVVGGMSTGLALVLIAEGSARFSQWRRDRAYRRGRW